MIRWIIAYICLTKILSTQSSISISAHVPSYTLCLLNNGENLFIKETFYLNQIKELQKNPKRRPIGDSVNLTFLSTSPNEAQLYISADAQHIYSNGKFKLLSNEGRDLPILIISPEGEIDSLNPIITHQGREGTHYSTEINFYITPNGFDNINVEDSFRIKLTCTISTR